MHGMNTFLWEAKYSVQMYTGHNKSGALPLTPRIIGHITFVYY